ncbi:hypothetical protein AAFP35_16860 [Gordonia sp. CPCC 206044]|uniref:hypothetical protein n=1 Tax=Gordonia sp. CPCC 206044 TaxID=3140793 RepID=UPI003AF36733
MTDKHDHDEHDHDEIARYSWDDTPKYVDREGNPLSLNKCVELQDDPGYRRIVVHRIAFDEQGGVASITELTDLHSMVATPPTEADHCDVATTWIGIRLFGQSFETMLFGGPDDGAYVRYENEEEAIAGHHEVIEAIQARGSWIPARS